MLIEKPTIPILDSIAPFARQYDVWFCDIWGVVHNGVRYFPPAVEACQRFREGGGTVIFITNAPRPSHVVRHLLDALAVAPDAYDRIVSSGDVTMALLKERLGQRVYHLGPERDHGMLDGLDLIPTGPDDADFILNSGPFHDDTETPDDYTERLGALAAKNVPMICANPDIKVERGDQILYCAGALAEVYRQKGGEVVYAGKPYAPIYHLATTAAEEVRGAAPEMRKILAIGDGVKTDILGASDFGIDSVFIASGVHIEGNAGLNDDILATAFEDSARLPVAAQNALKW